MNVLLVNALDKRFGSTYRARQFHRLLAQRGHQVTYVESSLDGDMTGALSVAQKDGLGGFLGASWRRLHVVATEDYDVLLVQKLNPLTIGALLAGRLRGRPVILDWDDLDSYFQTTRARSLLAAALERTCARLPHAVITHNRYIAELAHRRGAHRVFRVAQGVDTALFDPSRFDHEQAKEYLGLANRTVCCFVGTLTQGGARDVHFIIEAVARARQRQPDLFLLIVGGGNLESTFRQRASQRLGDGNYTVTGLLEQGEVPFRIAAADLALVYMRQDPGNMARMSLKLLEYLSMGKKVVAHLTDESQLQLEQFCMTADETPEAFAATVVSAARTNGSVAGEAREFVRAHFDWQVIGDALDNALSTVANGR